MSALTASQSKKIIAGIRDEGHSARIAGAARKDSAQNVEVLKTIEAGGSGQTTVTQHTTLDYVGFCPPTTTDYPNATIGSKYREFSSDTTKTSPYAYKDWVLTEGGWSETATNVIQETTLTAAQLKALNTTEQLVVTAPSADNGAIVSGPIEIVVDSGSTAYDGIAAGEDLKFSYGTATDAQFTVATMETTGFLDQTTNSLAVANPDASAVVPAATAINVSNSGAIYSAAGDLGITIRVPYKIRSV